MASSGYQAAATSDSAAAKRSAEAAIAKEALESEDEDPAVLRQRKALGVSYMLAMGVCGIVLVAIGSNLKQLASNCHTTATHIGSVFIVRGAGAVIGAVSSAKLYRCMNGNRVMFVTLMLLTGLVMVLPVVTDVVTMHILFGLLGTCTSITDTGCQIQTRKVHGAKAGPWLGVNTVVFSLSGAFVPLIALATDSLFAQCGILAGVTLISAVSIMVPAYPEQLPTPPTNLKARFKVRAADKKAGLDDVAEAERKKRCESCPCVRTLVACTHTHIYTGGSNGSQFGRSCGTSGHETTACALAPCTPSISFNQ